MFLKISFLFLFCKLSSRSVYFYFVNYLHALYILQLLKYSCHNHISLKGEICRYLGKNVCQLKLMLYYGIQYLA